MSGIVGSRLNIRGSGLVGSLGTDGQHLLSSGAGKTNVFETVTIPAATDLTPVRQDILTLALKQAVEENHTKYNLPNSSICKFEADADFDLAGSTTVGRYDGEYIASGTLVTDGDTVALFHFDNNITDSSSNAYSFTNNGSTGFSTSFKKFGTHGLSMDGSNDDISGTISGIGTGDFTVDWWSNTNGTRSSGNNERHFGLAMDGGIVGGSNPELDMGYPGTHNTNSVGIHGDLQSPVDWTLSNVHATSTTFDSNTWVHHAIQRSSTTLYYFCDGIREGTNSCNANDVDGTFTVGGRSGGGNIERYTGYFDEFRVSSVARYSTSGSDGDTIFTPETSAYPGTSGSFSATGTALGTTNVPTSPVTDVSGVILLKDAYGSTTLGTDVKVYYTCDNSNFTEATSYADAGTFSTGIKMIKLGKSTCTEGSDVRWKIVWASQVSESKEAHIYAIGLNY